MKRNEIDQLLHDENKNLNKLHDIVKQTIVEEELIVNNLLHPLEENLTEGQKISDKVAQFGGSWKFILFLESFFLYGFYLIPLPLVF